MHGKATLEATNVWLMTSSPAAFRSHIKNELQAFRTHLDLEDSHRWRQCSTPPQTALHTSEKLTIVPGSVLFFDPISYLWSGKPDLYAKQIIQKLSSLISVLQKIFRSHTISSTGKFSSKQFSKIKRIRSKGKKRCFKKQRMRAIMEDMDQETSCTC